MSEEKEDGQRERRTKDEIEEKNRRIWYGGIRRRREEGRRGTEGKMRKKIINTKILIPKCPVYFYIYFSIYETL